MAAKKRPGINAPDREDQLKRVEIRVPNLEWDAWERAAQLRGIPTSEFIRIASNAMAAPSRFRELARRILAAIADYEDQGGVPRDGVIDLTPKEENDLLLATNSEVGGEVMGVLILHGARKAFPTLFGYRVRFGASSFQVRSGA